MAHVSPFYLKVKLGNMVTIDQLRISDDGGKLYVDAHVNKARYFDKVYLDEITVYTEEQFLNKCPDSEGEDYIYKAKISTEENYLQAQDRATVLSGSSLLGNLLPDGGISLSLPDEENSRGSILSFMFGGKYSVFDGKQAVLVFTNDSYTVAEGISGSNVLCTVTGKKTDGEDMPSLYVFRDKARLMTKGGVRMYLFAKDGDTLTNVSFDSTDDREYLHLAYLPYFIMDNEESRKQVHLVLCPLDFNEKFCYSDFSKSLLFVCFKVKGTPSPDTPCRFDETVTTGVTFDYGRLFNRAMCFVKHLSDECSVPHGMTDFILHLQALKLAVETEHYAIAAGHFRALMGEGSVEMPYKSPCGCR